MTRYGDDPKMPSFACDLGKQADAILQAEVHREAIERIKANAEAYWATKTAQQLVTEGTTARMGELPAGSTKLVAMELRKLFHRFGVFWNSQTIDPISRQPISDDRRFSGGEW